MTDEPVFDESATPSQNPDVDLESLSDPPSSNEFYLYSRIDGNQTVKQLCQTSGLGRQATLDGLKRLVRVGLVTVPGVDLEVDSDALEEESEPADEEGEPDEESSGELGASGSDVMHRRPLGETSSSVVTDEEDEESVVEESSAAGSEESESSEASEPDEDDGDSSEGLTGIDLAHLPIPPSEFDFDQELLDRDIPMKIDLRRELLCLSEQLDDLTHYQFFGVDRDADGGEIKKSYFMLSKRYHPDKHFRKEIGPFKEHLEKVFQKITRSYRTLSDDEKRAEYDQELAEREATGPTPMNQPSTVRMAHESATGSRPKGQKSGEDKRSAAFAKLVRKAEQLRQKDEYVAAADTYRKALSLKRDLKVAIQAARVLLKAGVQIDQAELFARAALRIDEEHVEARLLLGRALEQLGKQQKALQQYERLLEIEPDHNKAIARRRALSSDAETTSS